jgi:class 3 adenylate cyclase/cold shock CspA family protein
MEINGDLSYFDRFRSALDQTERPNRVVLFADIVGSTEMKSKGEVTWLPTVGKFYDVVHNAVEEHGGQIVKYLGDGAIATFSDDAASDAINAAIRAQEQLGELRHKNVLICQCSIGLASGQPVEFTVSGMVDYIGETVDLAARLCSAAAPNAVWADASTISVANMGRVKSELGKASRRDAAGYRTGEETIRLKGIAEPVLYHEIIWSGSPFGVRNSVVTAIVRSEKPPPSSEGTGSDDSRQWMAGSVVNWNGEKTRGFIRADGEDRDRYVIGYWIAGGDGLRKGQRVVFHPRPAVQAGKNDTAMCVVPLETPIQAQVALLPEGKPFGFLEVRDSNRTPNRGIIFFSQAAETVYNEGDWVTTTVATDRDGRPKARILTNK